MTENAFQPPWAAEPAVEMAVHVCPLLRVDAAEDGQGPAARHAFAVIARHLAACRAEEGYCLTFADQEHLACFLRACSEERPFLRQLAQTGRLDAFAGYHQRLLPTAHGETLLRNLALGLSVHLHSPGLRPPAHLLAGAGPNCLQLAQLLAQVGVEAIVWIGLPSPGGPPPLSHLTAPDGSSVILKSQPGECLAGDIGELLEMAGASFSRQARTSINLDLLLLEPRDRRPAEWLVGRSRELAQLTPCLVLSTPTRYFAAVKPEAHLRRASLPVVGEELGGPTELDHRAWKLAQAGGAAERAVLSAERLAALAHLAGARYPAEAMQKAWRQVLYAHGRAGTGGDGSRLDLLACYREAMELGREISNRSLSFLAGQVDTTRARRAPRQGAAIVVFNTAGWERTDVCEVQVRLEGPLAAGCELLDDRGRPVPAEWVSEAACESGLSPQGTLRFVATGVPALGFRTWYLRPARSRPPAAAPVTTETAAIENEFLSISAESTGGLTSLYSKVAGVELLDLARGPGMRVVALGPSGEARPLGELQGQLSVWQGAVSSQIEFTGESAAGARVRQCLTLYHGLPRLEVHTSITAGGERDQALALSLPLTLPADAAVCGSPFGAVVRSECNAWLRVAGRESDLLGCWMTPDWVDLGPVPSLVVISAEQPPRALPLARCAIITSANLKERAAVRVLLQALLSRGVPCHSCADADDLGAESGVYSLRISLGRENAYSQRVLEKFPAAATRLSEALAESEWAAVLVPGDDLKGTPTLIADTLAPRGALALIAMLAEAVASDRLAIPEACDFVHLERPASGHGLALVGAGPMAAGSDGDGRPWCLLTTGDGPHVTCHQAIVPHPGDWREGRLSRSAHEMGNPLLAVHTPLHAGSLPPQFSLCSVDQPNLIITSCKPTEPSADEVQIALRMYESHGKPVSATLRFGAEVREAWLSDPLEGRGQSLSIAAPRRRLRPREERTGIVGVEVGANEIITLGLRLADLSPARRPGEPTELGPSREPGEVLFSRYWDHHAGAPPLGGQPLTLWMRGELPIGKNTRFSLGLSNDSDQEMSGRVQLIAPEAWTLIPRQVPYRIPPWSEAVYEIMIVVPPEARPCFLRATVSDGLHTLLEVLPIGEIAPLSVSLSRAAPGQEAAADGQDADGAFVVTVANPNPDYVEGEIALIAPPGVWPGPPIPGVPRAGAPSLPHWRQGFRVEAGSRAMFSFPVIGKGEIAAVARVAWYGNVQYARLPI